ncbi:carboxypeptidase-like regulatory domain-containing protein [uncultured Gimesia sp.]|uniref:carboxypeptidase-like regulatory domain-containing protein n=1 Tax=uncultured Gimesia sp. TaxID=1678688 RepID=UPI00260BB36E|nr:carboxypeptidase-like regulatory domain-containing protein [uncultured Gimesia sp.]
MKSIPRKKYAPPQSLFTGLLLVLCICLAGCGQSPGSAKPRRDVTIQITSGSDPVAEAQIDLVNEQTGEGGGGTLDSLGKATIANVALGTYTLTINPPAPEPVIPGIEQPATKPQNDSAIPKPVRTIKTSPLKVDVKSDANEFTFDLKAAG